MLEQIRPEGTDPDAHVFLWDHPVNGPVPFSNPRAAWEGARKRAGLNEVRIHDLRHTYASRLVRASVSLYQVQRLLGHASPVQTQRYAHLRPDDLDAAVSVLD